jgi:hypothetical protein
MPTYRNDTNSHQVMTDTAKVVRSVAPGATIESYELTAPSGMTKTLETPYYNPAPASGVHAVSSTGAGDDQTVALTSAQTDEVEIYNESDAEITVFLRSADNTPGLKVFANSVRTISDLKDRVDALFMQFSAAGSCTVTEIKS